MMRSRKEIVFFPKVDDFRMFKVYKTTDAFPSQKFNL